MRTLKLFGVFVCAIAVIVVAICWNSIFSSGSKSEPKEEVAEIVPELPGDEADTAAVVVEEVVAEKPVVKKPVVDEPVVEYYVVEEAVADSVVAENPKAKNKVKQESSKVEKEKASASKDSSEDDDNLAMLKLLIVEMNKQLPQKSLEGLYVTRVYLDGGYLMYLAECDESLFNIDTLIENAALAKAQIVTSLKTEESKQLVALCILAKKGIGFKYVGKTSNKTCPVRVSYNELKSFN